MNIKSPDTIHWLQQRLHLPLPGEAAHGRMLARVREMPSAIPADARPSAVLALLFAREQELSLLLIRRTEDGRAHSGQISFPGGRQEPYDADLRATALREAQEEVGLLSTEVDILGGLTPLYIPVSNFMVYPYVGFAARRPEFKLNASEVAGVLEVPFGEILREETKALTQVVSPADPDRIRQVNAYRLSDGSIIWGATAMMLAELEMLISESTGSSPV